LSMPVLSRTQQNDVYQIVRRAGLDPVEFEQRNSNEGSLRRFVESLIHPPTQSWITFSAWRDGQFWIKWWPLFGSGDDEAYVKPWNNSFEIIQGWAHAVRSNHEAPELWAEARKARKIIDAAGDVEADNTPFNLAEIELMKPTLAEIEAYIESKQPLNDAQRRQLHGRFKYLLGAAKRGIGRIDWLNIFMAQLFQLFTDSVVHSSLFADVTRFASAALASVVNFGSKLLGP